MPSYRCTMIYGKQPMAASETYLTGPTSAPADALAAFNALIAARNRFLMQPAAFLGVRIGQWTAPGSGSATLRRSRLYVPPGGQWKEAGGQINVPGTAGSAALVTNYPDQFRAAIQLRLIFDGNRTTTRYLCGVPEQVFDGKTEGLTLGTPLPGWTAGYNDYLALLKNGSYYIAAQDRSAANLPYLPLDVTQDSSTPPLLKISVSGGPTVQPQPGQRLLLQGFRAPKGTRLPTLNGAWTIKAYTPLAGTVPASFTLRDSSQLLPSQVRIVPGSKLYLWSLIPYQVQFVEGVRGGIHKRGRPTTAPRGRRLSRPTLDP